MSPEPASYDPEEFVDGSQPWPRLLALKDGEFLAKGEVFEHQTAVRPKPAKHGSEPEPKQVKHGNQVIADRLCRLPCEVVDFKAGQDCDEGQIIEQIWKAKKRRQLIFSSHNANFVVNGDAELVVCCDYVKAGDQTGGQIKCAGAIDTKVIKDEITTITEGGEEAFKLRRDKYGF